VVVPNCTQKQPIKKGEPNCSKTWRWCPPAPRNNKIKTKKRKGGGESKLPLYGDLAMAPTCAHKKKPKKRKKRGSSSFPSTETWPWCPKSNKKRKEKGGASPLSSSLSIEFWL